MSAVAARQQLYLRECEPQQHASVAINNTNLDAPSLVRADPRRVERGRSDP